MQPLEVVKNDGPEITLEGKEIKEAPPVSVPTQDELLHEAAAIGAQLRELIVKAKRLPREKMTEPHQDPLRSLAQAQVHLQTGFMWLRRAIEIPKVF